MKMKIDIEKRTLNTLIQWCERSSVDVGEYIQKALFSRIESDIYGGTHEIKSKKYQGGVTKDGRLEIELDRLELEMVKDYCRAGDEDPIDYARTAILDRLMVDMYGDLNDLFVKPDIKEEKKVNYERQEVKEDTTATHGDTQEKESPEYAIELEDKGQSKRVVHIH